MTSKPTLWGRWSFLVRCLRYRRRAERLQIRTMMRLQLQGATVLDIGANKGIYCFWLARAVGPSGQMIAFEPQPKCDFDKVPHHKFGMTGHRDFLFFPPEAIGTTIPLSLSRQFPQAALAF